MPARLRRRAFAFLAMLFATSSLSIAAQCTLDPDGLDGPCCAQNVTLTLPQFPPISLEGLGLCITDCSEPTTDEVTVSVLVDPPSTTATCTQYVAPIRVQDDLGADLLTGSLTMDYSRTWMEETDPPVEDQYQVWRFLVKVDLATPLGAGSQSCPVPTCIPVAPSGQGHEKAFFYGYVDYARLCSTGAFESVLVLFHNCDLFIHGARGKNAISKTPDNPVPFHPDTKYAVVAPRAGFVRFDQTGPPPFPWEWTAAGGLLLPTAQYPFPMPGGMRTVPGTAPVVASGITCQTPTPGAGGPCTAIAREPIDNTVPPIEGFPAGGATVLLGKLCDCLINTNGRQAAVTFLLGGAPPCGAQNSSFISLDTLQYGFGFPWLHNSQVRLGKWVGSAYPGNERVYMSEGFIGYGDACQPSGDYASADFFYGVYTREGFALEGFNEPGATLTFFDAASNYSLETPVGTYVPSEFVGCVSTTNHVIGAVFGILPASD